MSGLWDRVTERESVWERMRACGKPVALYGMGDGAQKILDACARYGVEPAAIFASDGFVRGQSFAGREVARYRDLCGRYGDFLVAIAFASQLEPVMRRMYEIAGERETVAPDVPVVPDGTLFTPEYLEEHRAQHEMVYELLADERSREVFSAVLNYKISGKLRYLRQSEDARREGFSLLRLTPGEHYVDLGAYRGDTIGELLAHTGGRYGSITAFEPDGGSFKKLCAGLERLGVAGADCRNLGAWDREGTLCFEGGAGRGSALSASKGRPVQVDSVDHVLGGRAASYIKFDVEGAERMALLGCRETIAAYKPKLCVSLYHRNRDLFDLPLLVHELEPSYRLYLRRFPYVPAWDLNLYAL